MTDTGYIHWTDNEELVERYVLNRVEEGERTRLDAHLSTCGQCRRVVDEEQMLVGAVRSYAKDRLKQRLARSVGSTQPSFISWQRIVSAAAVVAIATTVAVYFEWLKPQIHDDQPVIAAKTDDPGEAAEQQTEELGIKPRGEVGSQNEQRRAQTPSSADKKESESSRDMPVQTKTSGTLARGGRSGEVTMTEGLAEAAPATTDDQRSVADRAETDAVAGKILQQAWLQGSKLPVAGVGRARAADQPVTYMRKDAPEDAHRKKQTAGPVAGSITILQRPFQELPIAQQSLAGEPHTTTGLLTQTDHGLELVLYLETLVSDEALGTAQVEKLSDDSVVVLVAGYKYEFRLPEGWSQQSNVIPSPARR
jgi:hypothetical protein